MSDKKKQVSPLMNAIIGGITGAMEITCTYPTEYTKTVMQLYPEINKRGAINCAKDTIASRGIFGLYRGYSSLLFFSVPKNYVRFGTYHYTRDNIFNGPGKLQTFMCGLTAGAAEAALVVTPMETIKVKLIHDKLSANPQYKSLFSGIHRIISEQGFGGVYRGFLATLIKQSTNQGTRFLVFEDTQRALNRYLSYKVIVDLLAGAIAGAASVFVNNPIDVVKTNMQGLEAEKYGGFAGCFAHIMKHEGPRGFYKGVGPRLSRVCLDVALTFSIFNSLKRALVNFFGR